MFQTKIIDDFKGLGKCIHLTNGVVELMAALDIGPRICYYGFVGGKNILLEPDSPCPFLEPQTSEHMQRYYGKGSALYLRGGHRLWVSPEYYPETYYPDNFPIEYEIIENGVVLIQKPQIENQIQLKITITLSENSSDVTLKHEIKNLALHNQQISAWAISMLKEGGTEIIKRNTKAVPYLPNGNFVFWPFSMLNDDCLYISEKYFTLNNPAEGSTKYGFGLDDGETYYAIDDVVFINKFTPNFPNGVYPDFGSNYETFSCEWFTEIETLSESKTLAAGETIEHIESWKLVKKPCEFDRKNDDSIKNFLSKL